MQNNGDLTNAAALGLSEDDAELFHIALGTYIATSTTPDGSVSVDVSSDGTIHRWHLNDSARRAVPEELVSTVIDLISQARVQARAAVRAGFGLDSANETFTPHKTPEHKSEPASTLGPAPTATSDDAWDDDEDYYHQGKSRIAAD
ncbi:hypothetical protein AB0L82_35305 [Nocardia sp. NPDC052001]|uniref:hypothetical protein n=1 Tax=Nocardia sp. NPDC052001 TaxID=3154853 RepID=UPI003424532D